MSKKYIAIQDCEYKGKIYRTGETILFPDDMTDIATLFWKPFDQYEKELEEERVVDDAIDSLSEEEKDAKIKELTKELKKAKKEPAKAAEPKDDK